MATLPLQFRDLTGADLGLTDLRHVNFEGAILNRADLTASWAENAQFHNADLRGASLFGAHLAGASLDGAGLQGALLDFAQLQDASLFEARVQGASLVFAQLQGTRLARAHLQGASFYGAHLQGASPPSTARSSRVPPGALLQGASFGEARREDRLKAMLRAVRAEGTLVGPPTPEGSQIVVVWDRVVYLARARVAPNLVDFSLDTAQLQGASFVGACVWRADARQAAWEDTIVVRSEAGPKTVNTSKCNWTADSFLELKRLIAKNVPDGDRKRAVMETIEQRLDPAKGLKGEDEMTKFWAVRERDSPTSEVYEKSLGREWRKAGCAAEGAPYVLHALIARLSSTDTSPFRDQSDAAKTLAAAFLDEAHCAGAHGLSEADKAALKKVAAPAASQAPKP
jgi:uncharacterized protein YjbI with pentapeptide repeats